MTAGPGGKTRAPLFGVEASMTDVANWHVIQTRSQCEQSVCDQLAGEGHEVYLPRTRHWTTPQGEQRLCGAPLFPGFLFLRGPLDRDAYDAVRRTRGLIAILGQGPGRCALLPDGEMETIRRLVESGVPLLPHAFLRVGRRARVKNGLLSGIEGILARSRPDKGLFVMSFDVLQRSVAVEMEPAAVEFLEAPAGETDKTRREAARFLPFEQDPQAAA
jgi:transcriptional antiterminator NusG